MNFIRMSLVAVILGLGCAMPAGATSASSYSAAGEPAAGGTAAGTAIAGSSGSGGESLSAGIDTIRTEHDVRASDWAGWIGGLVLLILIVLAAVRVRYELRRQR